MTVLEMANRRCIDVPTSDEIRRGWLSLIGIARWMHRRCSGRFPALGASIHAIAGIASTPSIHEARIGLQNNKFDFEIEIQLHLNSKHTTKR